ncbi:MAG TPA: hypothetical protein VII98_00405 [Solirubrobacteraceae bacterium]
MAGRVYDSAKDFIDTQDYDREELERLLDLIALLKDADKDGACPELLRDVSLGMIFEEPSTRTGVSFEVAMVKLGGHALYLRPGEIHMGARESIYDTAKVLSRMCDVIEARTLKHETCVELARWSDADRPRPYRAPGGNVGAWLWAVIATAAIAASTILFLWPEIPNAPEDWSYTGPLLAIVAVTLIVGEILVARCMARLRREEAAGTRDA